MQLPDHKHSWRRYSWPAYKNLLLKSKRPILVGPWRSELGFEVNYWLPFIEKLVAEGLDRSRLIPITRGGAAPWYAGNGDSGIELYDLRSVQDVRVENKRQIHHTHLRKHDAVSDFDRLVIRDAAKRLGLKRYHVLHPAWMYHLLAPFWTGQLGLSWLSKRAIFSPIQAPQLPDGLKLPEQYLCVRFYARDTLPMNTPATLQFVQATVATLAATVPVVVLESRIFADDHSDFPIAKQPNVFHLPDLYDITPQNVLAVQTAVLGRAQGFVGTYGGFAQLALRMGKPSVSFYLEWGGTSVHHKFLSDFLSLQMRVPFQVHRIAEIALLRTVFPQVEFVQVPHIGPVAETVA